MPDDPDALARLVHEQRVAKNAEKERPFVLTDWDGRTEDQKDLDRRIASAVATQAVADAGVDATRMRALLFAIGQHVPAALEALSAQIADEEYEAQKTRFRDAEAALQLLKGSEEAT